MRSTEEGCQSGGWLETQIGRLEKVCTFVASAAFTAMLALIGYGTLARYFFNRPLPFVDEYSGYLLLAMGFLAMAGALRRNLHITVDLVTDALPVGLRRWVDLGSNFVGFFIAILFFWIGLKFCYENYSTNLHASTIMETPLWIPQAFIPLGWAAFVLAVGVRIKKSIEAIRRPNNEESQEPQASSQW